MGTDPIGGLPERDQAIVILAPYAERFEQPTAIPLAPRLDELEGKTIGLVDNTFPAVRIIHAELRRHLGELGCTFTTVDKKYWTGLDAGSLDAFAASADAFVSGLGNTPPSTRWNIHESVELERRGKPTVTLVTAYYDALADEVARSEGLPEARRISLPYPIESLSDADVASLTATMLPHVIAALSSASAPVNVALDAPGEP